MAEQGKIRVVKPCRRLEGEVVLPGDKSISHRAAILNSLASGEAEIGNFSPGRDCFSTVACLRALGVKARHSGDPDFPTLHVRGWARRV